MDAELVEASLLPSIASTGSATEGSDSPEERM